MLQNIQALRGVAAFLVVFVHLQVLAQLAGAPPGIFVWGNSGVDLFFVISGLIMVMTAGRPGVSAWGFLRDRFSRVAPFYWLVTLAVFVVALAMPGLLRSTQADPLLLVKSLAFIPYVRADGLTQPLVFLGWTLNYEMAFYLLLAIGLLIPDRRWSFGLAALVLIASVAAGLVLNPSNPIARFYSAPMLLEFAAGMGLGVLWPHLPAGPRWSLPAIAVAALAFLLMLAAPGFWPDVDRAAIAGAPAVVIVGAALIAERSGWVVRQHVVRALGDASYSIYLTHFFITATATAIASRLGLTDPWILLAVGGVCLVTVAAAGVLTHRLVETPLIRLVRSSFARPRRPAVGAEKLSPVVDN